MQEIVTSINNSDVYVVLPDNYNSNIVYPVLMGVHGSGREARSYRNSSADPAGSDFYAHQRDLAINSGYIFCVISNGANTWGLDVGLTNLINLYNYIKLTYNVEDKWVLWATSAGGTLTNRMVKEHPDKVERVLGTFPVYDLNVEYDILQSCRDAWGSKANFTGKNPAEWPGSLINVPYLIYHGQDDTAVPVSSNSTRLRDEVNRLGGNIILNIVTGGHSTDNWAVYRDYEIRNFLNTSQKNIIAFGDSIVTGRIGFHTDPNYNPPETDITHSWEHYLANRLNGYTQKTHTINGYTYTYLEGENFTVYNHGHPGWNTTQLLARFNDDVITLLPNYVIIAATCNDPRHGVTYNTTVSNLTSMIQQAINNDIEPILAVIPPHDSGTYKTQTEAINQWLKDYAKTNSLKIIDWYVLLESNTTPGALDSSFVEFDLIHPNKLGYQVMGNTIPTSFFKSETSQISTSLVGNDHTSEGFLATLPSGDIIHVFRLDPELTGDHVGNGGRVAYRKLPKNSSTWSSVVTIYDDQYDDRNVHGGITNEGRIVVFFRRVDATNYPSSTISLDMNFIYSDNEGVNWSARQVLSTPSTCMGTGTTMFYVPTRGYMNPGYNGSYYQEIRISSDGSNWNQYINPISTSECVAKKLTEVCYAYVGNGRIIGLLRHEDYSNPGLWMICSSDYGNTWSSLQKTNIPLGYWTPAPTIFWDEETNYVYVVLCDRRGQIDMNAGFITGAENQKIHVFKNKPEDVFNSPNGFSLLTTIDRPVPNGYMLYGYPIQAKKSNGDWLVLFTEGFSDGTANVEETDFYEFTIDVTEIVPNLSINIESNPLSLQLFGTFNINSTGNKSIGYIKVSSQDTKIGDIAYLEYSTNQIQWTLTQLSEIPNNKYCKINLFSNEEVYYFRFSILRNGNYFYSDVINSNEFYKTPQFNDLKYIKVSEYNYLWLNCDIKNLYQNEDINFQISQNQSSWTDVNITYINNSIYRYMFLLNSKSGIWCYRVKVVRLDETFYSEIKSFNLDEMVEKNIEGYNPYLPKSPVSYTNSKLKSFKLGSLKLGKVLNENPSMAKLGSFKLSKHILGSYIVIDIQLKTDVNFVRYYSNLVESNVVYDLLRYYSNSVQFDINYDLKKVHSIIKLLSTINSNIELEAKQLKDIKIKCITNPEVTLESIINKEVELKADMQFQIDIEAKI